jgi:hypothetical protein
MEVHVMVSVDVVEREARHPESLKLGKDFRFQLNSHLWPEKKIASGADKVRGKLTRPVHQIWNSMRGEGWGTVRQHQVQADFQGRKSLCSLHGIFRGLCPHHQTSGGETASPMRLFDRIVHCSRKTEVVACDDQTSSPVRNDGSLFDGV